MEANKTNRKLMTKPERKEKEELGLERIWGKKAVDWVGKGGRDTFSGKKVN